MKVRKNLAHYFLGQFFFLSFFLFLYSLRHLVRLKLKEMYLYYSQWTGCSGFGFRGNSDETFKEYYFLSFIDTTDRKSDIMKAEWSARIRSKSKYFLFADDFFLHLIREEMKQIHFILDVFSSTQIEGNLHAVFPRYSTWTFLRIECSYHKELRRFDWKGNSLIKPILNDKND